MDNENILDDFFGLKPGTIVVKSFIHAEDLLFYKRLFLQSKIPCTIKLVSGTDAYQIIVDQEDQSSAIQLIEKATDIDHNDEDD